MLLSYYAARANLYFLWHLHPDWHHAQFAQALGTSPGWVKKWLKRLRDELADGRSLSVICQGASRARKQPPAHTAPEVVERVLALRDAPADGLRRVPGQDTIRYFLCRDPMMQGLQLPVPSARTIYRILSTHQRIAAPRSVPRQEPMERAAPMQEWQMDFKDVSSVPADAQGKQQHVVETLNIIDTGTSLLLAAHVRADFTAETALEALAHTLAHYGCPQRITLDRDTRWVGSPAGSDFPAALLRFGACLGIQMQVCAPHHPQQNGFVERYHRTYQEECLSQERPADLEHAQRVTATFREHYNRERPHQGHACDNRPPLTAFPALAPLAALPPTVNPDSWLDTLNGLHVTRKVDAHGMISIDLKRYYVSSQLVGYRVDVHLDAATRSLHVFHQQKLIKTLAVRGLVGTFLSFEQFLLHMLHQACAQRRLCSLQQRRFRTAATPSP